MTTIELGRDEYLKLILDLGQGAWTLYSVMLVLSGDDGLCQATQRALAEACGATDVKVVTRRIEKLSATHFNGVPLVKRTDRRYDGYAYEVALVRPSRSQSPHDVLSLSLLSREEDINTSSGSQSPVGSQPQDDQTVDQPKTAKAFMQYWRARFLETYGSPYMPRNWAIETNQMKKLLKHYGPELLRAIVDTVFQLYDAKWKTAKFLRPTVQSLMWMAVQAEPFATAELKAATPGQPQAPATAEVVNDWDGSKLLEDYRQKGWL